MVLITGCPLLIVKKREITVFHLKKAQTVRSFCATHRVKTQLPTKLLIRYFLSSIEENTVLFFSRRPGKSDPWKSSRQSINLYRPHQKKLRLFGGNVVEWLVRWTCDSVAPRSSPALGPVVRTPVSANPGFFFFLSKAYYGIIFSILFRVSNHQIVGKEN